MSIVVNPHCFIWVYFLVHFEEKRQTVRYVKQTEVLKERAYLMRKMREKCWGKKKE